MSLGRNVLLFDLDGTLVDSAPIIAAALSVLRRERGGDEVSPAEVRPWISLGVGALVANALGGHAGDSAADIGAFREVLRGMPNDPGHLYPGVAETLWAIRNSGTTMAIVTNKPEQLSRALLDDVGIGDVFSAVVGGDTTPYSKPHRAPIDRVLELLDTRADQCLFIGDSEVDAAAARIFAMPFLLFSGGYGGEGCRDDDVHARFSRFVDLPAVIARLKMASSIG